MIKKITITLFAGLMLFPALMEAQDKRAQTTMKFLQTSPFAGPAGMGNAMTAIESRSSQAMFYNPASMARIEDNVDVSLGLTNFIADIDYNAGAVAYRPARGQYGVVGVNAMYVDYGRIDENIIDENAERGYRTIGTFGPYALRYGLGYANAITTRFMVGATFNIATYDLGSAAMSWDEEDGADREGFSESTFTVDFGVLYHTGFESLTFAMSVRNFSREIDFDDKEEDLPLEFRMGLAMDMLDLTDIDTDIHSLKLSVDAKRLPDYYEQLMPGLEYTFMDRFSVRGGYQFPSDEAGVSAGFGLKQSIAGSELEINYSYTDYGIFDGVNRFSFQFSL